MKATERRTLYNALQPYRTGRLRVSELHELYFECSGNQHGKAVVVLHGGPGGGSPEYYRQFHDPKVWNIICYDQRGAGKSTPLAELRENSTQHLIDDLETLRKHLAIDKWVVFGGSWGSTLALAYAEQHAERVKALQIRGIFTLRRQELEFFYQEGSSFLFPDYWEQFINEIPEEERGDLMMAYYKRLTNDANKAEQLKAARAWSTWEMATSRLYVDPENIARAAEDDAFALAFARIECHFFVQTLKHAPGFFQTDDQLIRDAYKLKDIPTTIVQGRYDLVCPAKTAWDLYRKGIPHAELHIIPDAGHSAKEEGIIDALVRSGEKYAML